MCHWKAIGAPSTWCNGTNTPSSRFSQLRTQRTPKTFEVKRCSPLLGNKLHTIQNIKMDLRKWITQREVINLALLPQTHSPHIENPTSFYLKIVQTLRLLQTAVKIFRSDKPHLLWCDGTGQPEDEEYMVKFCTTASLSSRSSKLRSLSKGSWEESEV